MASIPAPRPYPYGQARLCPQWHRRAVRARLAMVVALAIAALATDDAALAAIDLAVLRIGLPALLAALLAIAPDPATRTGRRLKDRFVLVTAASPFLGDGALALLGCAPWLLAANVLLDCHRNPPS